MPHVRSSLYVKRQVQNRGQTIQLLQLWQRKSSKPFFYQQTPQGGLHFFDHVQKVVGTQSRKEQARFNPLKRLQG
jgi:hypothetical protein